MPISHASLGFSLDFKGNLNANVFGTYTSPIFDTETEFLTAVDWASSVVNTVAPSGATITAEYRAGANTGAVSAASWVSDINTLSGRFLQIRLKLNKDDSQADPAQCTDVTPAATSQGSAIFIEESTTNLLWRSQEFGTSWSLVNATLAANQCIAPDGTLTADRLVEDATAAAQHRIEQTLTITANGTYTFSVYVRKDPTGRSIWLRVRENGGANSQFYVIFNPNTGVLSGGAATAGAALASSAVKDLQNGWYRVSISGTLATGVTSAYCTINLYNSSDTYSGDAASGVYLWGAQMENKPYPTSYIATAGATATRNAEVLSFPTANVIDYSKGTAIFKVYITGDLLPGTAKAAHYLFHPGSGASDNFAFYRNSSSAYLSFAFGAAGSLVNCNWTTDLTEGWHTIAIRWDSSEISIWANGVEKATAVPTSLPAALQTNTKVGCAVNDTAQWNSLISEVCIYDEALTDVQMAAETLNTSTNTNANFKMKFESNLQYDARTNELVWNSDRLDSITSQITTGIT